MQTSPYTPVVFENTLYTVHTIHTYIHTYIYTYEERVNSRSRRSERKLAAEIGGCLIERRSLHAYINTYIHCTSLVQYNSCDAPIRMYVCIYVCMWFINQASSMGGFRRTASNLTY